MSLSGQRLVAGVSLLLIVGCGGANAANKGAAGPSGEHPLLGAKAPDFDLAAQSGGTRASLASVAGKVAIIDFWATWCEPCKDSFPYYQQMLEKHAGKLAIIGISVDDEPDGIAEFASQTGAKFPLAWDEGQMVSGQYEPSTMPTSFVIDKNGIVRYVHAGFRDGDQKEIEAQAKELF